MRTFAIAGALMTLVLSLAACGGSGAGSAAEQTLAKQADIYKIDEIERKWHKAASTHDLGLMMSLWAQDASFTIGGQTYSGKAAIRKVLSQAGPFQAENHWVSDTPAYKIRTTVNGDRGTLYFECHYVDTKTSKVVAVVGADQDVQKIDGTWLITNAVGATPTLTP
jgi:ketosteroid isomerase-like protein